MLRQAIASYRNSTRMNRILTCAAEFTEFPLEESRVKILFRLVDFVKATR